MKSQERENAQAQESTANPYATKKNHFYALHSNKDQESSPDVVSGMLQLFFIDVYALLDPNDTFYFVTLCLDMKFDIRSYILD